MSKTSTDQKLARSQVAIDGVLADADLAAILAAFGYDGVRMGGGRRLHGLAQELVQRQRTEYGDLYTIQDAYITIRQQAHTTYMSFLKIARLAFEHDRGVQQTLNLTARRRQDLAGWLGQAQQFYKGTLANTTILSRLAAFGITPVALEAGLQQITVVITDNTTRQQHRGSALDATRQRDAAIAALESWMSDFLKVARVALKDRPQLLAQLGVAVPAAHRSGRTAELATPAGDDAASAAHAAEIHQAAPQRMVRRNGRTTVGEQVG